MEETKDQVEELFFAESIDAQAIETLRTQRLADLDQNH